MPEGVRAEPASAQERGTLQIHLHTIEQLFNSFDPSPFSDRDLDADAEEFLVGWAGELPRKIPLRLILHLETVPADAHPERWVPESIHHYFAERARVTEVRLQRLLRRGRITLAIGALFLLSCVFAGHWLALVMRDGLWLGAIRESLNIGGWVAMWQPLQIYLYDWWPIREQYRLYRRMSLMSVHVLPAVRGARAAGGAALSAVR